MSFRLFQIIANQQGGEGRFLCKAEGFTQVAIGQAGRRVGELFHTAVELL